MNSPLRVTYKSLDNEFMKVQPKLGLEYNSLFSSRTQLFLPILRQVITTNFPSIRHIQSIPDAQQQQSSEKIAICGLIYKDCKKRPNLIKLFQKDRSLLKSHKIHAHYTDPDDELFLEDKHGRVQLTGNINFEHYITGVPLAITGSLNNQGKFVVDTVVDLDLPPQRHMLKHSSQSLSLVFLSDLRIGADDSDPLKIELLTDFLCNDSISSAAPHQRTHVYIAGSSLTPIKPMKRQFEQYSAFPPEKIISSTQDLDAFLSQLCSTLNVTLLPGPEDPSSFFLPQHPIHHSLIPSAYTFSTFTPATNPHKSIIHGMLVIGMSSQIVVDLMRFTSFSPLECLEALLKWNHLAPNAPDSLPVAPTEETDPFLLDETPSILFVGGMDVFESKVVTGGQGQRCLLLSIPSFCKTGTVITVDPSSFQCNPTIFDIGLTGAQANEMIQQGRGLHQKKEEKVEEEIEIVIDELDGDDVE
ncbi:putative DNA polymerase delta small subunit [Blattamonas nauphoetae]|uniref:DNA polymerase delta small subunit n=1 Tax=Blattamonas nauphoetae TaxID=2049346 RepID=A0ABQ9YMF7_9EUKA|nr:putative DNA polymerase delta small subunit [Blattamonas nauphoetae]